MMDKKVKDIEYEYDVFVLILDQTGITRMQRFFLNTYDLLRSMESLSVKDKEAFQELERSDTGWVMVNDNQTLIVKSGIDTNFITTFRKDGNLR
tara:strand:- start:835 stop:1116 length:282 start_codon:yes stop_codon:yes gene_type:complete